MITKIHFIVNPIAGSGKNKLAQSFLERFFEPELYELVIKESQYPKHAIVLANESLVQKANIIVACGGDGTINEVASCLVNTTTVLGIIPMGSGNGLASNLKISKHIEKALKVIKTHHIAEIDAGMINDALFFSNTGIGFDAHVISDFEANTKRKLISYLKSVFNTIKVYDYSNPVEVSYNNKTETLTPFLLFVSNSNEMGYNMSLTPNASLQDGVLDMIIVPKLSVFKMFLFTLLFLFKKHYWLKQVHLVKTTSVLIKSIKAFVFKAQKDGESIVLNSNIVEIKIMPRALKVCAPLNLK